MMQLKTVNFSLVSESMSEQLEEVHNSRALSRADKQKALIELGLKKEDLRIFKNGIYYNPFAPIRVVTPKGEVYTFGVEMECFVDRSAIVAAAQANGVRVEYERYNHTDCKDHYKFVTDASVCGMPDAIECVSPILKGNTTGFASLKKACKSLNDAGARVNKSCGLHVHVGGRFTDEQIVSIYQNYKMLESLIDSFMAPSRRNNQYAMSFRGISFEGCNDNRDIFRKLFSRYFKVNPCAMNTHHTIEFRQHQGTTDYQKVSNWVKFCIALVGWSKDHRLASPVTDIEQVEFLNDSQKAFFKSRIAVFAGQNE